MRFLFQTLLLITTVLFNDPNSSSLQSLTLQSLVNRQPSTDNCQLYASRPSPIHLYARSIDISRCGSSQEGGEGGDLLPLLQIALPEFP